MPTLYEIAANKQIVMADPKSETPSMVVDTWEDFERVSRIIERADGAPWKYDWRELQGFVA